MRPIRHSTSSRWSGLRWSAVLWWCDRYVDSMLAYQGAGRRLEPTDLEHIARWATEALLADLTVVLDAELSLTVHAKSKKDRLESAGEGFTSGRGSSSSSWRGVIPSATWCSTRASREEIAARWPLGSRRSSPARQR